MTHHRSAHPWMAAWAALTLCLLPSAGHAMEMESGLKNLRCVHLQVDVEQDQAVQSRVSLTEEQIRNRASTTLKAALPLLSISQQCGNRFRLLLVLHDVPGGPVQGYNGLLITGVERVATVLETGDRQQVEVWSGGIQEFRGPLERATTTATHALSQSLDHFAEAYRLSGNP